MKPIIDRFFEKVHKTEGCHFWIASRNRKGYGTFQIGNKSFLAHRVAWFLSTGAWPKQGLLHSCDTPQCIRKGHLREGTDLENQLDAAAKGKIPRLDEYLKEFCKRGHPRIPENLYIQPSTGWRRCKLCFMILMKSYRHR